MAKEIIWSPEAERTFSIVIEYLLEKWNIKVAEGFVASTEKVIHFISRNPLLFRRSAKTGLHEVLITKHNLLLYQIKGEKIYLITFWDTRRNPKRKPSK